MHVTGKVVSVTGSSVISGLQCNDCLTEKRCKLACSEWSYSDVIQTEILLLKTTNHGKNVVPAAGRKRGRGASSVLLPQKSLMQTYCISWE